MTITVQEEQDLRRKAEQMRRGELPARDPLVIIERMEEIIPTSEVRLLAALARVTRNLLFAAPEIKHHYWGQLSEALTENLGEPDASWTNDAWQWRVGRIMRAEE